MRAIVIAGALALAGCAGSNVKWVKAGATPADFDRDKMACEYDAAKATASGGNFGMSTAMGAGIAEAFKQAELQVMCMQVKGWTRTTVPNR